LKAANEELESYAETELQEFSQHTAIQKSEVETKQPMKAENSTSGKALEAVTTSTVKPVQDAPKMSEFNPSVLQRTQQKFSLLKPPSQ